jgi:hypothetical protein
MKDTSTEDVRFLQKFVDLSRELSEQHHRRMGTSRKQFYPKFEGRYSSVLEATAEDGFAHTTMASEIRNGYPQCLDLLKLFRRLPPVGLLKRSELAYESLLSLYARPDIAADFIVVAFYLLIFASSSDEILFP